MKVREYISYLFQRKEYQKCVSLSGILFANNDTEAIKRYQINSFNEIWKDAYSNIPFYKKYKKEHQLPDKIHNIEELDKWPIVTKRQIMENQKDLLRNDPPDSYNITSGSTGVPLKIPVKHTNSVQTNMWIGRAANGILPNCKTFIIWGHHHLYGTGIKRVINTSKRRIKDWICNYKRISAYDTSALKMRDAFKLYGKYLPEFVIGYSSSILAFVRCNKEFKINRNPKKVLCTAGSLSESEKNEIREFFGAPICMEYGSMECGVMAYTIHDADYYKVFWNTHLLQGYIDENNKIRNIVTLLTKKYFPLIRYDIGDWINIPESESLSDIFLIKNVEGRPTDIVTLESGTSFFAMLIEACVEHLEGIISHQLIVEKSSLTINIVGLKRYSEAEIDSVRKKLYNIIPDLKSTKIQIIQVNELIKAKSGKTPLVIRK